VKKSTSNVSNKLKKEEEAKPVAKVTFQKEQSQARLSKFKGQQAEQQK
jgi:hypothetical protein